MHRAPLHAHPYVYALYPQEDGDAAWNASRGRKNEPLDSHFSYEDSTYPSAQQDMDYNVLSLMPGSDARTTSGYSYQQRPFTHPFPAPQSGHSGERQLSRSCNYGYERAPQPWAPGSEEHADSDETVSSMSDSLTLSWSRTSSLSASAPASSFHSYSIEIPARGWQESMRENARESELITAKLFADATVPSPSVPKASPPVAPVPFSSLAPPPPRAPIPARFSPQEGMWRAFDSGSLDTPRRAWPCPVPGCTSAYKNKGDMRQHVRRKHADALDAGVVAATVVGVRDKSSSAFPCPLAECSHGFRWRRDLLRHFRQKHWDKRSLFPDAVARHHLKCNFPGCEATFARHNALHEHEATAHRPPLSAPQPLLTHSPVAHSAPGLMQFKYEVKYDVTAQPLHANYDLFNDVDEMEHSLSDDASVTL